MRRPSPQDQVVLRQSGCLSGSVLAGLAWLLCALVLLLVLLGNDGVWADLQALAGLALLAWCGWVIGAMPRVVLTPDDVKIVNPLRTFIVPRRGLRGFSEFGLMRVDTAVHGQRRTVHAWGGPSSKPRIRTDVGARGPLGKPEFPSGAPETERHPALAGLHADVDRNDREGGEPGSDATAKWNKYELLVLAGILGVNISIWLR